MTTASPKLCKDCRHARKPFLGMPTPFRPWKYAKCTLSLHDTWDAGYQPVDGIGALLAFRFCSTQRGSLQACGPDAKFWEPRK